MCSADRDYNVTTAPILKTRRAPLPAPNGERGEPMPEQKPGRAHLIAGGYPPGQSAGHDHDYARLKLLELVG